MANASAAKDTETQQRGIALVTGAGSGIGRAAARALMADGWSVVAVGRRLEPLQETLGTASGGQALSCDISDEQQVEALFQRIESDHGRLDVLFNNAGIFPPGALIDEMSVTQSFMPRWPKRP